MQAERRRSRRNQANARGSHTNPTRERGAVAEDGCGRTAGPLAGALGRYRTAVGRRITFLTLNS